MNPVPFESSRQLEQCFMQGLERMLREYDELGVYILVLANASFESVAWTQLKPALRRHYERFVSEYHKHHELGLVLDDAGDDLVVFRRLMGMGMDAVRPTEFRQAGPWEVQFNLLRSLRPARMAQDRVEGIQAPFDADGFHFDKPFLHKEILWQGWLGGRTAYLLYNKFPFVSRHGLLVPEPRQGHPQFLHQRDHEYLWHLTELLERTLPGVGFGYNSYGAYASVNHLHFQFFQRSRPLPVCHDQWRHNGGETDYPAPCFRFQSPREAWRLLDELQQREISFNLLYIPGNLYCLPRRKQGHYNHSSWTSGFAWYEMAGGITTFDYEDYQGLDSAEINRELALAGLQNGRL